MLTLKASSFIDKSVADSHYGQFLLEISSPEPKMPVSVIPHISQYTFIADHLPIYRLLSLSHYPRNQHINLSPILSSIHTPIMTGEEKIDFYRFQTIIHDILALWGLNYPTHANLGQYIIL